VGGAEFLSGESPAGVDAFYGQVANRADVDIDVATAYSHAVATVLHEAISEGEMRGVTLSLPTSLIGLLDES
jgi:uncharacterized protein (DUF2267 family)